MHRNKMSVWKVAEGKIPERNLSLQIKTKKKVILA